MLKSAVGPGGSIAKTTQGWFALEVSPTTEERDGCNGWDCSHTRQEQLPVPFVATHQEKLSLPVIVVQLDGRWCFWD
jgi:hypothetical protein